MQHVPQICFRNIDSTETVRGAIQKHVTRLERFFPRIIGCRVIVESRHHHHRRGNPYHVRVEVEVPGRDIIVNPNPKPGRAHDDIYVAISDTFLATGRKLQDYARKRRGNVKAHPFRTDLGSEERLLSEAAI